MKPWTEDEMRELFVARTTIPLKPYALIGAEMGRNGEAIRDKWRKTNWEKLGYDTTTYQETRMGELFDLRRKTVNAFDKRHHITALRSDAIADALERSVEALPNVKRPAYRPRKKAISSAEDVGLLFSDLHIGHQHTLEETGGISEYSQEIFIKRLDNLREAVSEIVELHRNLYELPKLHIFCAGDVVAGMNEAGQWSPLWIAAPIVDQMISGADAIGGMIEYWLGMFDEIHFYGIAGNHGRTAQMGVQKHHDNWDYVCYKFLELRFRNNPRVKFHVPKSWWLKEEIRGHSFLMVHGDYCRGGSLPLKSLQNFEQKMSGILKDTADYTLAGHYHNSAELTTSSGKIILNGSFVGSDIYSLKDCHAASVPEQKLFGIHDRWGITWTYNINLDGERGK